MNERKFVKVVVLGDIGRSPRMQYHCKSLSEIGHQVDVIGYGDSELMDSLKRDPLIFYHYLLPIPQVPIKLLNYAVKTVLQALNLLFLLFVTARSDIVLMQNPPAIPAVIVCWIYATIVRAKFIIDWHNYAHTIMALSLGESHPLVRITKKIEIVFGRRADHNFCVTKAMKDDLEKQYGIKSTTLYDRPPSVFKPITVKEQHDFLLHCCEKYNIFLDIHPEETAFTAVSQGVVTLKSNRPGLLISSTSWTEDEDFGILLTALQEYETHCQNGNLKNLPKLICAITGKGPLKEYYCNKLEKLNWQHVTVITPWLEPEDYPFLLAAADLGVSLHTSSSGLDLPMKVVDMFGCGLPVCAFNFKCLEELVRNGENSYTFSTPLELSKQVMDWFTDFPNNERHKHLVTKFKTELKTFQNLRWQENWNQAARYVFK